MAPFHRKKDKASQFFLLTSGTRHCQVLPFEPMSDAPDLISQTVVLMGFTINASSIPQEYLSFPKRHIIDLQRLFFLYSMMYPRLFYRIDLPGTYGFGEGVSYKEILQETSLSTLWEYENRNLLALHG